MCYTLSRMKTKRVIKTFVLHNFGEGKYSSTIDCRIPKDCEVIYDKNTEEVKVVKNTQQQKDEN